MHTDTGAWSFCLCLVVLSAVLIQSASPPSDEPWEPKVKVTPNNTWQAIHDYHVQLTTQIAQKDKNPVQIIFYGDSLTQFWFLPKAKPVWEKNYGPLGALNFGISGDRTENVLWRIQNGKLESLTNPPPKVVVLCIGTNNIGVQNISGADIAKGVETIVTTIKEKLPAAKIILLGLFPRPGHIASVYVSDINLRIARMDQRFGNTTDSSVTFLEVYTYFAPSWGQIVPELYLNDQVHLNEVGYAKWAELMHPTLLNLLKS